MTQSLPTIALFRQKFIQPLQDTHIEKVWTHSCVNTNEANSPFWIGQSGKSILLLFYILVLSFPSPTEQWSFLLDHILISLVQLLSSKIGTLGYLSHDESPRPQSHVNAVCCLRRQSVAHQINLSSWTSPIENLVNEWMKKKRRIIKRKDTAIRTCRECPSQLEKKIPCRCHPFWRSHSPLLRSKRLWPVCSKITKLLKVP